jgi:hypothetical protein
VPSDFSANSQGNTRKSAWQRPNFMRTRVAPHDHSAVGFHPDLPDCDAEPAAIRRKIPEAPVRGQALCGRGVRDAERKQKASLAR